MEDNAEVLEKVKAKTIESENDETTNNLQLLDEDVSPVLHGSVIENETFEGRMN